MPGDDVNQQDIRIAVVLTGGVSLAVWISGVTLELLHLAQASRDCWTEYHGVLELLIATARVDVIAGTSAGGINGAFLALGLTHDRDLGCLRELWTSKGALDQLLRDPLEKDPPSLLQGDAYFYPALCGALTDVLGQPKLPSPGRDADSPVVLILTGTLWDGRVSTFTDDMGRSIAEVDHDATFRFSTSKDVIRRADGSTCGDLTADGVAQELAVAARCTSSFPGAFEPRKVTVTDSEPGPTGRHASDAGMVNFAESQYVVDGGVLLNKPIRPALEAIYRQSGESQVRRLLAYIAPDPGEPRAGEQPADRERPPNAGPLLLGTLTRLRSTDSVSRELTEIRQRNEVTASRRQARSRFAAALVAVSEPLSTSAWPAYLEARRDYAARSIARLLVTGQTGSTGRWSERELAEALRRQDDHMRFIPTGELTAALSRAHGQWDWGLTTVERLADTTVDVLKRAVWLAPLGSDDRERIVRCRAAVAGILAEIRRERQDLDAYWVKAPAGNPGIPAREDGPEAAKNRADLDDWLAQLLGEWDSDNRRTALYGHALDLAEQLFVGRAAILVSCAEKTATQGDQEPKPGSRRWEAHQLQALYDFLLGQSSSEPGVLERMLRLDVVQLAFTGAAEQVEQQVELVQVSAHEPAHLTGLQMHHFGAFYRASWRVNDWLHGRMDGSAEIVRVLLEPHRLRQVAKLRKDDTEQQSLEHSIHRLAVGDGKDREWLEQQWRLDQPTCAEELAAIPGDGPLPASLPACSEAIARRLRTQILRDDLPALADAIRGEPEHDRPAGSTSWLARYQQSNGHLDAGTLWALWKDAQSVGSQRIMVEFGTDTFARTAAKAAAVATNTPRCTGPAAGGHGGAAVAARLHARGVGHGPLPYPGQQLREARRRDVAGGRRCPARSHGAGAGHAGGAHRVRCAAAVRRAERGGTAGPREPGLARSQRAPQP